MLHLLKSAKEITTLGVTSPKQPMSNILHPTTGLMEIMDSAKGNNLAQKNAPYSNASTMLSNRHKEPLNNTLLPGQRALSLTDAQPGVAGNGGSGGGGETARPPASKPRALWKKSVETLRQTQGPGDNSPPSSPQPTETLPMKSQRYLPEDAPARSDISDCSGRVDLQKQHKLKETLRKRNRLPRDLSDMELSTLGSQPSQQSNHSAQIYSQSSQGSQIYTIDSIDQEHGLHYPDIFSDHHDNKHRPSSSSKQQPILQLNSSLLSQAHEPDVMQTAVAKDKKYNTYGKPGGAGPIAGGPGSTQDPRQTHCRSCLSKVSSYSGLYTVRSPQYRCDACLHSANLYDISEDQFLYPDGRGTGGGSVDRAFSPFLPQPDASFTAYLPQSDQEGDGLISHYQNEGVIIRQHSYENLPQKSSSRRVSLQDNTPYANVPSATLIPDKPPKNQSVHLNHTLAGVGVSGLGIGRRSKSMYPARPTENPFLQTLRDDQRLAHGRSSTDIYKQLVPLTLGQADGNVLGVGMPTPDIYYSEHVMPYVALPLSAHTPLPGHWALGELGVSTRGCPSIESDVWWRECNVVWKTMKRHAWIFPPGYGLNRGTLGGIVKLFDYKASKSGIYFVSLLGLICLNRSQSSTLHQVLPSSWAAALCLPENIKMVGRTLSPPSSEGRAAKAAWKYRGSSKEFPLSRNMSNQKNLVNKNLSEYPHSALLHTQKYTCTCKRHKWSQIIERTALGIN